MSFTNKTKAPSLLRFIILMMIACVGVLPFLAISGGSAYATNVTKVYDTVDEFNVGTLYHTGLTADPQNGGDGNGEVRLLNVGINENTWNLGGTANSTGLTPRWGHAAAQYNGVIYVSGGITSTSVSNMLNTVHYATIQSNHNLSNWQTTAVLPGARAFHSMVAMNGYVYVIGGYDSQAAVQNTVYKSQINNVNGTLGAWTTTNVAQLPTALTDMVALTFNNRIYVIGGDSNASAQTTVFYATPDSITGNITAWSTGPALTHPVSRHAGASTSASMYYAGGADFYSDPATFYTDVFYYDAVNDNWVADDAAPLPVNVVYAAGVIYSGEIYIIGGATNGGTTLDNNIVTNLINADNSLVGGQGAWQNSNVLSTVRQRTAAVVSDDGWIYVIQGQTTGGTPESTIDYGPTVAAGGQNFAPTGKYTSEIINLQTSRQLASLNFITSSDTGTGISFQYRASNSLSFEDTSWSSPITATNGISISTPISLTGLDKQYVQFQVNLVANTDKTKTPVLNKVVLNYDIPPTPTPTSTPSNTPTNTPVFTNTPTNTVTNTPTATSTGNASATPTNTATPTSVVPPSATPTFTATPCKTKPAQPVQVSPGKNANLFVRAVPLAWQAANCGVKYKVIVRYTSKTGPVAFKRANITSLSVTTTRLDKAKTYVWKVRACNAIGCGKWSEWRTFKVTKQAK